MASAQYQALLAVELQREQEAEGKTLRGESVTDNSDDDDEFAPAGASHLLMVLLSLAMAGHRADAAQ